MLERVYTRWPVRGWHLQAASMGSIGLCITLWIRAKTIGEDERGNAERRALFVGLWPPMLWLMGDTVSCQDALRSRRLSRQVGWQGHHDAFEVTSERRRAEPEGCRDSPLPVRDAAPREILGAGARSRGMG